MSCEFKAGDFAEVMDRGYLLDNENVFPTVDEGMLLLADSSLEIQESYWSEEENSYLYRAAGWWWREDWFKDPCNKKITKEVLENFDELLR